VAAQSSQPPTSRNRRKKKKEKKKKIRGWEETLKIWYLHPKENTIANPTQDDAEEKKN
jgi:hypothetical protein